MTHPLSDNELATLSDADRQMLDEAVAQIPPEHNALFTALLLSTRGIVAHDVSGIRAQVKGWPELLDANDANQRDVVEAALALRAVADDLRAGHAEMRLFMRTSTADRADLRQKVERLSHRYTTLVRLVYGVGAGVAFIVARIAYLIVEGMR